jgi:hypothetical protein
MRTRYFVFSASPFYRSWILTLLSRRFTSARIRNTNPWINTAKTHLPPWLHNSAPFPLRPQALPFEGTNHSPMVLQLQGSRKEWPRLASGVPGPCKTRVAHMVINPRRPAPLPARKSLEGAPMATRTNPTSTRRSRIRVPSIPPVPSADLHGAPLAMNGALLEEMPTLLVPTMGVLQSMTSSEQCPPWTSTVTYRGILQLPSLAHSPTTHHASTRISRSSSRLCVMQYQMTMMVVLRASCNLSRTWTNVVVSSPEVHQALLARPHTCHTSVMHCHSRRGNSNGPVQAKPTSAHSRLRELGTKRNAFSIRGRRTRTSIMGPIPSSNNRRHRGFRASLPFRRNSFNSRMLGWV